MGNDRTNLDPATRDRLARGETTITTEPVPGCKNPRLVVRKVIDVPPSATWRVIDDVDRYKEFMPRVKVSRITKRGEDGEVLSLSEVEMPFPLKNLKAEIQGKHTVREDEYYERRWTLITGDFKRNEGGWTMVPFEGDGQRTLLVYDILVVPKIPIPKKIANAVQERAMPEMLDCVSKRVLALA